MESLSIWTGANKESWFQYNKLNKRRNMLKYETQYTPCGNTDMFYIVSVDVARIAANTAISVIKVLPNESGDWKKKLVNLYVLNDTNFMEQTLFIKKVVKAFDPLEVVVDATGMGVNLVDELIKESFDPTTGMRYDPIYVANDDRWTKKQPNGVTAKLWAITANSAVNSEMHVNCYQQFLSGNISLLANEKIAKDKLMATKKGQKMSMYHRTKFLLPYEMTSRLMDELLNLRVKNGGAANTIEVEQISRRILKDRFSSLELGLYRIKAHEDKAITRRNRGQNNLSGFLQFCSHKKRSGR